MASRTNIERLQQNPPDSARHIAEDGSVVNLANKEILQHHASSSELAYLGKLYFGGDTQEVPAGASITYTITSPPGKYVVQFARDLKVTGNIWDLQVLLGGTVTGGTPVNIQNVKLDIPTAPGSNLLSGTTVTGATLGTPDFIAAPGQNKAGGLSAGAGGTIVIYPPSSEFSVRAINTGNTDQRIHLDYIFAELTTEEIATIGELYAV